MDSKLARFKSQITDKVKYWDKNYASVPDIASAVEGWNRDINSLVSSAKTVTPSLENARKHLRSAYSNRDSHKLMMRDVRAAVNALSELDSEMNVSYREDADYGLSVKATLGAQLSSQRNDPEAFYMLSPVRQTLQTIAKRHYDRGFSYKSVLESQIEALRDVAYHQRAIKMNSNAVLEAIRHIENAIRSENNQAHFVSNVERAVKAVDLAAQHYNSKSRYARQSATKSAGFGDSNYNTKILTRANSRSLKVAVNRIEDAFNSINYVGVKSAIPQIEGAIDDLISASRQYDVPRITNLAIKAAEKMQMVRASFATKSNDDMAGSLDLMMRQVDEIASILSDY